MPKVNIVLLEWQLQADNGVAQLKLSLTHTTAHINHLLMWLLCFEYKNNILEAYKKIKKQKRIEDFCNKYAAHETTWIVFYKVLTFNSKLSPSVNP